MYFMISPTADRLPSEEGSHFVLAAVVAIVGEVSPDRSVVVTVGFRAVYVIVTIAPFQRTIASFSGTVWINSLVKSIIAQGITRSITI